MNRTATKNSLEKTIQAEFIKRTSISRLNTDSGEYEVIFHRHIALKDIAMVIDARRRCDYSEVYKSKLYNERGGDYCELLEIIHEHRHEIDGEECLI